MFHEIANLSEVKKELKEAGIYPSRGRAPLEKRNELKPSGASPVRDCIEMSLSRVAL